MKFVDGVDAYFGNSSDFQITHDGSNTYLNNGTGNLYINENTNDGDLVLQCDDGSGGVETYLMLDGSDESVRLPADNKKLKLGSGTGMLLSLIHI